MDPSGGDLLHERCLSSSSCKSICNECSPACFNGMRTPGQGTGPYTFTATVPDNCQQHNCDYYVATKIHSSDPTYVDFWIEGTAVGYVALGLSSSGEMVSNLVPLKSLVRT